MPDDRHYLEKELEELIQNDPEIWKFLRRGSLDGVWYWDLQDSDQEYMSPEFWENFGFDPATKKHRASEWQDLIYPEDLEIAKENVGKHLADPSYLYDQVVRYRRADGGTSWVRCRGIAIRDDDGNPVRLLGAHNDITALKEHEQETEVARDELETIFNAATSAILAFDKEGRILKANSRALHILGETSLNAPFRWPEEIEFLDAETLQPFDAHEDPVSRALSGRPVQSETHLLRRRQDAKTHRYVRVKSAQAAHSSSRIHVVLVMDDVSDEERNRQVVERKNRLDALGQLTGGIAHDFNNLLAAQLYAVDLAGKAESAEKRHRYLDAAAQSIERGKSLTTRLLSFARRQPGRATSRRTLDTLREFETLLRPMIEEHIELLPGIESDDLMHYCDQTQLETALMNLVLNARDAIIRAGKGNKIEINARPVRMDDSALGSRQDGADAALKGGAIEDSSFRYVEFSVSDNGPGMDEETLARCTDPFFTTKDTNSGTGLGLAMVYGFVRQSNGALRVYSEEDVGTTVQITLPRGTEAGTREAAIPDDVLVQGMGQTILVVEDELELLVMICDLLRELGYHVIAAKSGHEALALIKAGQEFDLLLTDIVMPGNLGGFELARQVRELRPDVPVVYTSGYTGFTAAEMGAVQAPLLQKPASPDKLARALAEALHKV